jgi:cyclomaltodextrinase
MKKYFKIIFPSVLFLISACSSNKDEIIDIIKPINLIAGKPDSILIGDMFYSNNYDIDFFENKNVRVVYNNETGMIYFFPDENFSGITLVDFDFNGTTYSIPVRSRIQERYKFSFRPGKEYKVLNLFGSFNGWDRGNLPMKDDNNDGIFEAEIALEPGRYQYKFFGDGEEIIDPENKEKVPNGMGDFNSVFTVEEETKSRVFLHIIKYEKTADKSEFNFYYENDLYENPLQKENVIALVDNKKAKDGEVEVSGRSIKLMLNNNELKSKQLLRIAVTVNGTALNIQSVFFADGEPAEQNGKFLWNDAVIYSLMIDRFSDGDRSINNPIAHDSLSEKANYMGGDFQGIINKLNEGYFDSLGINTIWLSPVYDNPNEAFKEAPEPHRWFSGYHGYWPINSTSTEEKFGSIEKLKELVATAQKHGIKILLDIVANHVHQNHPFFKEKPEWFGNLNLPDGRLNLRLWDEYRLTTWFEPYLPKFNYVGSKDAIDFMTSNTVWWMKETEADGFRQDAVKHMPNEFWRALTKRIKNEIEIPDNKKVYQIGETFGSYDLISSYVNNGQLSAQFNFNVYDVALPTFLESKMSFAALDAEIKKSFLVYGENNLMGNIMDSHDKNRFMAFADGDLDVTQWSAVEEGWNNPPRVDNPANYEKAKLYYAYMNTIPGLPVIYYGSEFGMTGASDPDNRRVMRFGEELNQFEKRMLGDVRKIINLRKNHPALRYGDFLTLQADENIYSYIRSGANERILIILNKSEKSVPLQLNIPLMYGIKSAGNLLTDEKIELVDGSVNLILQPMSYSFFKLY